MDECSVSSPEEEYVFIESGHYEITSADQPLNSTQDKRKNTPFSDSPSTEETWDVQSVTPRKYTRVAKAPKCIVNCVNVAGEDP